MVRMVRMAGTLKLTKFFFVQKVKNSATYIAIVLVCSLSFPLVFIYKFCKKDILIQAHGNLEIQI